MAQMGEGGTTTATKNQNANGNEEKCKSSFIIIRYNIRRRQLLRAQLVPYMQLLASRYSSIGDVSVMLPRYVRTVSLSTKPVTTMFSVFLSQEYVIRISAAGRYLPLMLIRR